MELESVDEGSRKGRESGLVCVVKGRGTHRERERKREMYREVDEKLCECGSSGAGANGGGRQLVVERGSVWLFVGAVWCVLPVG